MVIHGIIPARGGSKGLPGKNIRQFNGKPLLVHSIEYALSSGRLNTVFVSTDDEDISRISRDAGAQVIWRPHEISGDTATTESVIEHAISEMKSMHITPDILVLLQPTSPHRPEGSLDAALDKFLSGEFDSMLSVSPTHRFFWRVEGNNAIAEYDYLNRPRRQDMREADIRYVENGSLYIFTRENFKKRGNRLGGRIGYTVFPEEFSMEIDTQMDFEILEKRSISEK